MREGREESTIEWEGKAELRRRKKMEMNKDEKDVQAKSNARSGKGIES